MLKCSKCKLVKEALAFNRRSDFPHRFRSHCKLCVKKPKRVRTKRTPEQKRIASLEACKRHRAKPESKVKHAIYEAAKRASKLKATPPWLTQEQHDLIGAYYSLAQWLMQSFDCRIDVDHIVPLRGKDVCGLHVPWNLQVMDRIQNIRKNNKHG